MNMKMLKSTVFVSLGILSSQLAVAGDWDVSGFVRIESAAKTTSDQNENNWAGNSFNGKAVTNTGIGGTSGSTVTRPGSQTEKNDLNLMATRLELDVNGRITDDLSAKIKLRGFADHVDSFEDAFVGVNSFEQDFDGDSRLETAGDDWMLDLPQAYLDYSKGPLWLRVGNQQIAWGEALFFRVSDVVNGLDLRRHSVLDVVAEEYSDKRTSGLGIRGSFRFNEKVEFEGFAQQAQVSILSGENSPYNVIPAQFVVHEEEGYEEANDFVNFGGKLRFESGNLGGHIFAVRRRDPNGVFKWTEAKGSGAVAGTPFEMSSGNGVYSAAEWFHYASLVRLDGLTALESSLNEFPATTGLGAPAVAGACGATNATAGSIETTGASAGCILDTFFDPATGLGDLRGHLKREFPKENVFGFALNYIFEGEPDTFMDQLIGRFELSYTPNKKFTNPSLSSDYIEADETQFALILEKYHKFSNEIPATYMVAQWLHKTESDLFGRHLSGMNNTPGSSAKGKGSFNAVAFAFQQPSPTLEWRYDLAVLTDFQGGWLIQPGVRWKPNKNTQLDVYANILESDGGGDDFAEGMEYANEVFARFSVYF